MRERVGAGLAAVQQIFAQVLRQGVESDELPPGVNPALAAQTLVANLHGMLVMAKAGASQKSLNALQAAALSSVTGRSQ